MNDLISWLRTQLDTDEADINRHPDGEDDTMFGDIRAEEESNYPCFPYLRINKAFALRQVQAHRAILDRYELALTIPPSQVSSFVRGQDDGFRQGLEETIKAMVSIYSDRDGYKEEWSA